MENLRLADERARRGKRNSYGVRLHDMNREENLRRLHGMLLAGEYRTSEYTTFIIHEPKERVIYRLPYFPDRIVHHAIMNVLEGVWTRIFTADTYSCIRGRGIHAAVAKLRRALDTDRHNCRYCLKMDIRKFYPSISHGVLKRIIRKKIKDKRLLALLDGLIDSTEGVPIGNHPSAFFANLVLAYFDHTVKEVWGVCHYWRYSDDMVVLDGDKGRLQRLRRVMEAYLLDELCLEVKENVQVFPVAEMFGSRYGRGIDFLGYVFFFEETRLRKRIWRNYMRALDGGKDVCSWEGWCKSGVRC